MSQQTNSTQPRSANNDIAIEARNLSLSLGGKTLLDDFSLQIKRGQLTALLGPNGAGKSTLLKVMCGEVEAEGEVNIFDYPRQDWPASQLAKHLGVLPQHSSLTFAFTAQEVVELGALPLELPNAQAQQVAHEKMAMVGVTDLAPRLYPTMSGGEKQRVHFARVLTQLSKAGENCILMLDEPTSALDLAHQHNALIVAKQMAQAGAAVIIVIHDLNLAAQYADRLVIINHGKIQADGTPKHALTAEIIESVYGWPVCITQHPVDGYPIVLASAA